MYIKSIIAGFVIGIAGTAYLAVGEALGAILFAWGLICIIGYNLNLYTGKVGFIQTDEDMVKVWKILGLNVLGCGLAALLFTAGSEALRIEATAIINTRVVELPLTSFCKAVGCGFIMTTAVYFTRKNNYLPLLFGIPLFILCGFGHCVADAFYILAADWTLFSDVPAVIFTWINVVFGNFIGCYLPTMLKITKQEG